VNREVGTYLRVEVDDGQFFAMDASEEAVVRRAMILWRERGVETVLEILHRDGYMVTLPASRVCSLMISTAEQREAALIFEVRYDEWEARFRAEHAPKEWE
jgi:hypothetical protein